MSRAGLLVGVRLRESARRDRQAGPRTAHKVVGRRDNRKQACQDIEPDAFFHIPHISVTVTKPVSCKGYVDRLLTLHVADRRYGPRYPFNERLFRRPYLASRLNVAVAAGLPGLATLTSTFHPPSMGMFAETAYIFPLGEACAE